MGIGDGCGPEMVMGIGGTVVELDEGINGDGNRDRGRPRLRGGLR